MAFQFAPLPDHARERFEKQRREDEKERLRIKQKEEEVAHKKAMYRLYKKRILDNPRLFWIRRGCTAMIRMDASLPGTCMRYTEAGAYRRTSQFLHPEPSG